jgi:DNA-binding TFAR19-related protein (PDSD5 family)
MDNSRMEGLARELREQGERPGALERTVADLLARAKEPIARARQARARLVRPHRARGGAGEVMRT